MRGVNIKPEASSVTFSDPDAASVLKFLNPGPDPSPEIILI